MIKKKIVQLLFVLTIFLLVVNIFANQLFDLPPRPNSKSTAEINKVFTGVLGDFGMDSSWIKQINKNIDPELSYKVSLPKDLPAVMIVNEFERSFTPGDVTLEFYEKKLRGSSILNVYSQKELRMHILFENDKELLRDAGIGGFLISDTENLNENETLDLLNSSEIFSFLLVPSKESTKKAALIKSKRKSFVVLLNDDISELDYKLRANYSRDRLSRSIKAIIGTYQEALFMVIDDKSNLYESAVYALLRSEFEKRGISFLKLSQFPLLTYTQEENLIRFINKLKSDDNTKKIFLITAKDYFKSVPFITRLRKKGCRFVNPSELLFASSENGK